MMFRILVLLILQTTPQPKPTITIDDGPNAPYQARMLQLLVRYRVHATWFISGNMLTQPRNRHLLRQIVQDGHTLGQHLWTHLSPCRSTTDLLGRLHGRLGVRGTLVEARRTNWQIDRILGYHYAMRQWRAPFGHYCRDVWRAMARAGYRHVSWDVDDIDGSAALMLRTVRRRWPQHTILLFHRHAEKLQAVLQAFWSSSKNAGGGS